MNILNMRKMRIFDEDLRDASFFPTQDNLNDPAQFEQTAVSCSDWVGPLFAGIVN